MLKNIFRCPFEKKASQDGTLLTIPITGKETVLDRINLFRKGYLELYQNAEFTSAVIFSFPDLACESFDGLRENLFPFQMEILAAEMDLRLNPWLPHHLKKLVVGNYQERIGIPNDPFTPEITRMFITKISTISKFMPRSLEELSRALNIAFKQEMFGKKWNNFNMILEINGLKSIFYVGGCELGHLLHPDIVKTSAHTNSFQMVMCPLYPKEFGRYSSIPKIVVTRQRDFAVLSKEIRLKIKKDSNRPIIDYGIRLANGLKEMLPNGLWEPKK